MLILQISKSDLALGRILLLRSFNMFLVLFSTLLITVMLLGPTLDKLLVEAIRNQVIDELNQSTLKFQNSDERQSYINKQIQLRSKTFDLDQKSFSLSKLFYRAISVMTLDLGKSHFFTTDYGSSNVRDIIFEKVPKTILLFTTSTICVTIIGIFLGTYVAGKEGSWWDKLNSIFAIFSNSFPSWWVAMIMILVFAFTLHIFPARATPLSSPSDSTYFVDLLYHMTLPLLTLILVSFGSWSYIVRYFLINILNEDFIHAKSTIGISRRKILYSHALRNAGPPIATAVALSLASSFGGSIITEAVFDWPGMGKLYYDAIGQFDIPIIIGLTYISTVIFLVTIFITDIFYTILDPRVKTN
jgi:peptide/nickel transport system permease protein